MTRPYLFFWLSALALSWAGSSIAAGPSFNCARAGTTIEKEICKHPDLSELDKTMADAFKQMLVAGSGVDKKELVTEQREWMARRNRECGKLPVAGRSAARDSDESRDEETTYPLAGCLRQEYEARISWLKATRKIYGKWRIYTVGDSRNPSREVFAEDIATRKGSWILRASSDYGTAPTGATTGDEDTYKILEVKPPYATYLHTHFRMFGGYQDYFYETKVFHLDRQVNLDLKDLFDQKEILAEARKYCGTLFTCGATPSLGDFKDVLCRGQSVEKSPWDFDSSKLDGFALGRAVGEKQVQVRLLFQDPCVKNPEEFSPQEITLTLTASPQVLEAVKSAGK